MVALRAALELLMRTNLCDIIDGADRAAALLEGIPLNGPLGILEFARGFKSLVCGVPPGSPPPPPFSGGQCVCQQYILRLTVQDRFSDGSEAPFGPPRQADFVVWGPVGGARVQNTPAVPPPQRRHRFFITCAGFPPDPCLGSSQEFELPEVPGAYFTIEDQEVIPIGGSDLCGDPPARRGPLPEGWNVRAPDLTFDLPGGGSTTINVPMIFGVAYVDADLNVIVPINIDLGGVNIRVNFDFSNDKFYYPAPPSLPPGGPDQFDGEPGGDIEIPGPPPGEPIGDVVGDEFDDSPRRRRVIRAVRVRVSSVPESVSDIFQGNNPNVYVPDLGLVSFEIKFGKNGRAWTNDIRVKSRDVIIPCPVETGALAVAGTPRTGVSWTLTPLYGTAPSYELFPRE